MVSAHHSEMAKIKVESEPSGADQKDMEEAADSAILEFDLAVQSTSGAAPLISAEKAILKSFLMFSINKSLS